MNSSTPTAEETAVCCVTHNHADDLPDFAGALERLESPPRSVWIIDCASGDRSAQVAEELAAQRERLRIHCVALDQNLGFAGGMNEAIARAREHGVRWIWSLNPDARPQPEALQCLLEATTSRVGHGKLGAVTPRLVRLDDSQLVTGSQSPTLDACGMVLTRDWRHLDRGSEEPDDGRYSKRQEVFGGTGAATLYRLDALDDVALAPGELFDSWFHSYREDAELAFRLQRRGWRTLYEPQSRVLHRRRVTPSRRRDLPPEINRNSLRNRYLLRAYHQSRRNALASGLVAWARDLLILGYVLLRERSSLGAYRWLWRQRAAIRERRRMIATRETDGEAIGYWFRHHHRCLPDSNSPLD